MGGAGQVSMDDGRTKARELVSHVMFRDTVPAAEATHGNTFYAAFVSQTGERHAAWIADRQYAVAACGERAGQIDERSFRTTELLGQHDMGNTHEFRSPRSAREVRS